MNTQCLIPYLENILISSLISLIRIVWSSVSFNITSSVTSLSNRIQKKQQKKQQRNETEWHVFFFSFFSLRYNRNWFVVFNNSLHTDSLVSFLLLIPLLFFFYYFSLIIFFFFSKYVSSYQIFLFIYVSPYFLI